jgi:hypothetical protein
MKRIKTFDLLRGLAILVMVISHRITWDYIYQHPDAQAQSMGYFIYTLFSTMAGIFYCISGAVNSYVNFNRLNDGKITSKQLVNKSILTGVVLILISVLFRYFLLRSVDDVVSVSPLGEVLKYNETGVLPYLILYGIYPHRFNISILFQMSTLPLIGYSFLAVSIATALYKRYRGLEDPDQFRKVLLLIGILIFMISGFTYRFLYGPVQRAVINGNILSMIFLSPFIIGKFPIFPHLSYAFFGAYFGVAFAQQNRDPKWILKSLLRFWAILLSMGVVIITFTITIGELNTWYFAWGQKLFQLGFFFLLFWLGMKSIDYQPRQVQEKRLKWMQPLITLGRVSLTVFILEGLLAVSLQRLIAPIWPNWNSSPGNAAFFGLINIAAWAVIITVWKKVDFAGSLEWMSSWLVRKFSGKKSNKLEKIQNLPNQLIIYNERKR